MSQIGDDRAAGRDSGATKDIYQVKRRLAHGLAIIGTLVLFVACGYRRIWHPEWPGGKALETLWPFYVAGIVSILVGWLFREPRNQ